MFAIHSKKSGIQNETFLLISKHYDCTLSNTKKESLVFYVTCFLDTSKLLQMHVISRVEKLSKALWKDIKENASRRLKCNLWWCSAVAITVVSWLFPFMVNEKSILKVVYRKTGRCILSRFFNERLGSMSVDPTFNTYLRQWIQDDYNVVSKVECKR